MFWSRFIIGLIIGGVLTVWLIRLGLEFMASHPEYWDEAVDNTLVKLFKRADKRLSVFSDSDFRNPFS